MSVIKGVYQAIMASLANGDPGSISLTKERSIEVAATARLGSVPWVPADALLPYPCDGVMIDTEGAQLAIEQADGLVLAAIGTSLTTYTGTAGQWSTSAGWTGTGNVFTHTTGTGALTIANVVAKSRKYYCYVTVTDRTAGYIQLSLGGATGATTSGTAQQDITSGTASNTLTITPSNDFDGKVSAALFKIYPYTLALKAGVKYPLACKRIVAVTSGNVSLWWYRKPSA